MLEEVKCCICGKEMKREDALVFELASLNSSQVTAYFTCSDHCFLKLMHVAAECLEDMKASYIVAAEKGNPLLDVQ